MKSTIIDKKILLLEFPGGENGDDNRECSLSMIRIDLFWESPDDSIKFKYSDWDTLIESISDENGNMDIYEWDGVKQNFFQYMDGYNVSKVNADNFLNTFKGKLTERELKFANLIKNLPCNGYIIGIVKNGLDTTRRHEFAHAFSSIYRDYKMRVTKIVKSMPSDLKERFWHGLQAMDYTREVLDDEIQAYLVGYDPVEFVSFFPDIPVSEIENYQKQISYIFEMYYSKV